MILVVFLVSLFGFMALGVPIGLSILTTVFTMATYSAVTSFKVVPTYLYSGETTSHSWPARSSSSAVIS